MCVTDGYLKNRPVWLRHHNMNRAFWPQQIIVIAGIQTINCMLHYRRVLHVLNLRDVDDWVAICHGRGTIFFFFYLIPVCNQRIIHYKKGVDIYFFQFLMINCCFMIFQSGQEIKYVEKKIARSFILLLCSTTTWSFILSSKNILLGFSSSEICAISGMTHPACNR